MAQFSIRLYATGDLAEELTQYQGELSEIVGQPAEPPYCSLVKNFRGAVSADDYIAHLDAAIMGAPKQNDAVVEVVDSHYSIRHHQLELSSAWVHKVIATLMERLQPTQTQICPEEALYLHLAFPADEAQHKALQSLGEKINWTARAGWDMKLYQDNGDGWSVAGTWPIQQP